MADQFSGLDTCANHTHQIFRTFDLQHTCCFAHENDWVCPFVFWRPSTHQSIYPFLYFSIHILIHSSTNLFIHFSIHISHSNSLIHPPTYLSIFLFTHQSMYQFLCSYSNSFIHPSTNLFIHFFIYTQTQFHSFIHQSMYPFLYSRTNFPIYYSICPSTCFFYLCLYTVST